MIKNKSWIYFLIFNLILLLSTLFLDFTKSYEVNGESFGFDIKIDGNVFLDFMSKLFIKIENKKYHDIYLKCFLRLKNMLSHKSLFILSTQRMKFQSCAERMIVIYHNVINEYPFKKIKLRRRNEKIIVY